MPRRLLLLTVLAAALLAPAAARPCGMTTHNEVTQRAAWSFASEAFPEYEGLLQKHPDALQPGSFFPDWGYAFGFPDESEAAHWNPFIERVAAYVRETRPKPWDEETEKLVVFLLGTMSHSVADIAWHFGYVPNGFLAALGNHDFDGSFGDAHDVGDAGGDMVCAAELDLSWMGTRWYVPVDDLAAVYHLLGYDAVTPEAIARNTTLMFVGMHAERIFGKLFFANYVDPAPFLLEEFQDYYSGGLDDMAVQTSWWWGTLIDWIETGAVAGTIAETPDGGSLAADHADRAFPFDPDVFARVRVERAGRGVELTLVGEDEAPRAPKAGPPASPDRSLTLVTRVPYSYLGTALAVGDWNGDGLDDLAVGAPGYGERGRPQLGAFYALYGRDVERAETIDLAVTGGDQWRTGADVYGRFGWALAACDVNADGRDDLAASAPTVGARDLAYAGAVFVYFGEDGGLADEPGLVLAGTDVGTNLGMTLASGDLDGDGFADLLIGSPLAPEGGFERGRLDAVLSTAPGERVVLARGARDGDRLGESAGVTSLGGRRIVLVGAPHRREGDVQEAGTLLGFDADALLGGDATPLFALVGESEFDKTGLDFAAGDFLGDGRALLAVSSPTRAADDALQAGSVALYPLDDLAAGTGPPPVATIGGLAPYARLGWRMAAADANGDGVADLWLTQPYRETDGGFAAGLAALHLGGASFPTGDRLFDPALAAWSLAPAGRGAHFGSAVACPDFNGDGSADVAVAARTDSPAARLGGSVLLAITPAPTPRAVGPAVVHAGETVDLALYGDRFSADGLAVALRSGDAVLAVTDARVWDASTIRAVLTVPAGAARGRYVLEVRTRFGVGTLGDALLVEGPALPSPDDDGEGGDDDEGGCGC